MLLGQLAKLGDRSGQQIATEIELRQRALRKLESLGFTALQLAVQLTELLGHHFVVGGQLEGALQVPDGILQRIVSSAYLAHTNPGKHMLRMGAQHALKHVRSLIILTGFEHYLTQQPIGFDVLGIHLQDVPTMCDGLFVASTLDSPFNLLTIVG